MSKKTFEEKCLAFVEMLLPLTDDQSFSIVKITPNTLMTSTNIFIVETDFISLTGKTPPSNIHWYFQYPGEISANPKSVFVLKALNKDHIPSVKTISLCDSIGKVRLQIIKEIQSTLDVIEWNDIPPPPGYIVPKAKFNLDHIIISDNHIAEDKTYKPYTVNINNSLPTNDDN